MIRTKTINRICTCMAICLVNISATSCSDARADRASGLTVTAEGTPIDYVRFGSRASARIFGVETDIPWHIGVTDSDTAWIKVSPHSGNGWNFSADDAINRESFFRVEVSSNDADEERSTVLTVEAGGLTRDLTVTQNAAGTEYDVAESPVMADATPQTVNVYDFLRDNYGKKVISGVVSYGTLDIRNAEYLHDKTGKYPVINYFDFMHHVHSAPLNPTDWAENYTDMSVPQKWWNDGGIVLFDWHWSVPKNESVKDSFDDCAFYSENNSFSPSRALLEGTWEHDILIRDLDVISGYLLDLQSKNVPVLWRPLHEAAGRWFWWGKEGPDTYKDLWKFMFEYFTQKGLRNLIWVWTGEEPEWYPGDTYVDVLGVDIGVKDHQSVPEKMDLLRSVTSHKICAITECGSIPSIEDMQANGDIWSWITPWVGGSDPDSGDNTLEFYISQYNSEMIITRDEVPDLK